MRSQTKNSKKESSASDAAHAKIRQLLLSGTLHAGQLVTQKELLVLLGMSLGPVRIALIRLETEGYLTIHPQRGIQIVEPTIELYREMLQVRIALEKEAWSKFASSGSEVEVTTMLEQQAALVERAKTDVSPEFFREATEIDRSMHRYVVQHMGNNFMSQQFRVVMEIILMLRKNRGELTNLSVHKTLASHVDMLTACKNRDAAHVVSVVENHLLSPLIFFFS